jgi:hypothetical protein
MPARVRAGLILRSGVFHAIVCLSAAARGDPRRCIRWSPSLSTLRSSARQEAPSIKAKALAAEAARSARGGAGSLPDPTLAVGLDSFPISGPLAFAPGQDNFTMARVGVSQDIPNSPSAVRNAPAPTAISRLQMPTPHLRRVRLRSALRLPGSTLPMPSAG